MSDVTLHVGGWPYTVSCADGEEDHVRHLAAIVDGKLAALERGLAPGDGRNLLFAALILADEVEEATRKEAAASAPANDDNALRALESLADRLESLAQRLESGGQSA